jgi:hypothetical protein
MTEQDEKLENLERALKSIEVRLSNLESILNERDLSFERITVENSQKSDKDLFKVSDEAEDGWLESRIGRIGLAWLGIIVLLFGIIFLTEYLITREQLILSSISGYLAVAVLYVFSRYIKKHNDSLSSMSIFIGQIILFYVTVRLHFFSANPLITGKYFAIGLMLVVVGFQTYIALRNRSQMHGALAVSFLMISALLTDVPHFMLPLVTAGALFSVLTFRNYEWRGLLLFAIISSYLAFFLWMFGNPLAGHQMQAITEHKYGYLYLFAIGTSYSILPLLRKSDGSSDDFIALSTIIHGTLFTLLLILVTFRFLSEGYVGVFATISAICLIYSVILKSKPDVKFGSAFFALYGFMAMSVAFYDFTGLPRVYIFLALQSLVVVSLALWFRNRLIIIMNSLLFVFILFVYMVFSEKLTGANFAFAFVSLLSARIINWKKERLSIKTDLIRNLYLVEAFVMVLFALFHAVPGQFVTLSWIAAGYFIFSSVLFLKMSNTGIWHLAQ